MGSGKNGRPTKSGQIGIQNKLRPYYEHGLSATFTAGSTGINIKTVCNYFDEWSKQILEFEKIEFVKRQITEKERIVLSMDGIIFEQYQLLEEIKNQIKFYNKDKKPIPKHLLSLKALILKEISDISQQKCDITITPTIDIPLEQMIDEKLATVSNRNRVAVA